MHSPDDGEGTQFRRWAAGLGTWWPRHRLAFAAVGGCATVADVFLETAGTPSLRCSPGGCCWGSTSFSPRACRWTRTGPTGVARTFGSGPTTRATSTTSAAGATSSSMPTTTSGTSTATTTRGSPKTRRSREGTATTGRSGRTTSPRTSGGTGTELQVVGSVYVEAEWDPSDPAGETAWAERVAEESGFPTVIVAQAWLGRKDVEEVLAAQAEFRSGAGSARKAGGGSHTRTRWSPTRQAR